MPDISAEIAAFRDAAYGEEVRGSMISLANKLNGNILSELDTMEQTWDDYSSGLNSDWASYQNVINAKVDSSLENTKKVMPLSSLLSYSPPNWIESACVTVSKKTIDIGPGYKGRAVSGYIGCPPNITIKYKAETNHSNVYGISFYGKNKVFLQGESNVGDIDQEHTVVSPPNTAYVVLSILVDSTYDYNDFYIKVENYEDSLIGNIYANALPNALASVSSTKYNVLKNQEIKLELFVPGYFNSQGMVSNNAWWSSLQYFPVNDTYIKTNGDLALYITYYNTAYEPIESFMIEDATIGEKIYPISTPSGLVILYKDCCFYRISVRKKNSSAMSENAINVYVGYISSISDTQQYLNFAKISNGQNVSIPYYLDHTEWHVSDAIGNGVRFMRLPSNTDVAASVKPIPYNSLIYFNDSLFKIFMQACDDNFIWTTDYSSWITKSPVRPKDLSRLKSSNGPYVFFAIRPKDNSTKDMSYYYENADIHIYTDFANSTVESATVYVSSTGSDSNSGSISSPFASVTRAITSGASNIQIFGGVYDENIDFNNATKKINISAFESDKKVIFTDKTGVICSTETKVSNYTNIYMAKASDWFISVSRNWIFQDGISDQKTLISDIDRHPLQRGYEYRCEDTLIRKKEANSLSEALDWIDAVSDNTYWFYLDNDTIYFSRPSTVNDEHPLMCSRGYTSFSGISRKTSFVISGISFKYKIVNVSNGNNIEVVDCSCVNAFGSGGFIYDKTLNVQFKRCEAARVTNDRNGDGFNGHSTNTGDPFSKQTTCTLIDCWSHDNYDDGYSDHERSEITIIGGLYEYNGKGGVTPSYGSHCTCYDVLSRFNYNGFYYTGETETEEGGKYGQMFCYNCIAEYNRSTAGFRVDGTNNKITLFNCLSRGNVIGFYSANEATGELINCTELDNNTTFTNKSNFTIINANTVV